ncbi:hypothetical protein AcW1_003554 [Taiwanofungus camphoratus]|nr:hypothetical protein AcV5_001983 [Antrodia cinnamomea]KAI0941752.1 hypothetical protein AcW1_003554 [Antrodia cinnamomea]KAI0960748.1 hypothetical protein AcV7_000048 [Antrodia cinnamomea]
MGAEEGDSVLRMDLPLLYHFSNGYYTELSRNYKHTVHAVQCPIRRILAALWRWLGSLASDLVSKSCLNQTLNMSAGLIITVCFESFITLVSDEVVRPMALQVVRL